MSKNDTTFSIALLAAKVQTVGQARAVLGKVSELLRDGYEKVDSVTSLAGLRDEYRRQLDIVNAYAQGVYAVFAGATPDLFDEEISYQNAARTGLAMERARKLLTDIETDADTSWWDITEILRAALEAAGKAIALTLETAAKAAAAAGPALIAGLWPLLLVAGLVIYVVYFRKRGDA